MKTVARLSAIQLVGRRGNATANINDTTSSSSSLDDTTAIGTAKGLGAGVGRWYETMTQKVNRIIDVALATFDGSSADDDEMRYLDSSSTNHAAVAVGMKDGDEEDDVDNVKKLLLATENSNMPNNVKVDCDDDYNIGEGDQTSTVEVEICDTDTVIDVITLATTCRCILTYIHQLISSLDDELKSNIRNGDKFFIPRSSGCKDNSQQRIMLHRVGWGISSFGALCVQAAKSQGSSSSSSSSSTILSNISQDVDLELIVQTLIESNYALVHVGGENEDVITIYPHGVPTTPPPPSINNEKLSSSSSSSSVVDMALFQIHNTKITIQTRMTQLATCCSSPLALVSTSWAIA
jgi:hypothetical protein